MCPPTFLDSVPDGPGPNQFSILHAIRVSDDGIVYVADRENRRVQLFTLAGDYIEQIIRNGTFFARNLTLSSDPDQRYLFVGGGRDIVIYDRESLEILADVEIEGMLSGHLITVDSMNNIYIAGGNPLRLQKLRLVNSN